MTSSSIRVYKGIEVVFIAGYLVLFILAMQILSMRLFYVAALALSIQIVVQFLYYYFTRLELKRKEVFVVKRADATSRNLTVWSVLIISVLLFVLMVLNNFDFDKLSSVYLIMPFALLRAISELVYPGYSDGLVLDRKGIVRQKFYLKNIPWENVHAIALDKENSCVVFYQKSYKSYFNFQDTDYERLKEAVRLSLEQYPNIEVKEMAVIEKGE